MKHGQARRGQKTSTYYSWAMMKNRCLNPKAMDFKYYGALGISVCNRWRKFELFRKDMGDKPTSKYTIGRINSKKNYMKSNCRWETRKQQSQSRVYCKLDRQKAQMIRHLYQKGWTQKRIAIRFQVSKTTAAYAATGRTWL